MPRWLCLDHGDKRVGVAISDASCILATPLLTLHVNGDRDAVAQFDRIAADVGAGVIVAGAYGHSRFRELVLGGMTQHLITQTARCVLLSH